MKKNRWLPINTLILVGGGILDAGFLTYEHYRGFTPPCSSGWFADCGAVLTSEYALIFGIPLALIGLMHYSILALLLFIAFIQENRLIRSIVLIQTLVGFLSSLYFVYLQVWVLQSLCLYCMISALISTLLVLSLHSIFADERKRLTVLFFGLLYKYGLKHMLFKVDPETIHTVMTHFGELAGGNRAIQALTRAAFVQKYPELKQNFFTIPFQSPIGLAAGFDYEARLTQTLPAWGFGFQTVGTMTNHAYKGNPRPLLGRLPRSQSLMVNKGFKNPGIRAIIKKLSALPFMIPVGISIGRTNSPAIRTQQEAITDIMEAFRLAEQSSMKHAYYELNISCPNLQGSVTFYPPENLHDLLTEVDALHIKRPLFIKMPIEKNNADVLKMLAVISRHTPHGVIFGNLQKNREDLALVPDEVAQFKVGNFSGKPTYQRSNELIQLAYHHYHDRFLIIGCGGVFSAQDAYEKIRLGASLVQLITGMIFEGPQLISQINFGLVDLLQKDGFSHISQAIGSKNRTSILRPYENNFF